MPLLVLMEGARAPSPAPAKPSRVLLPSGRAALRSLRSLLVPLLAALALACGSDRGAREVGSGEVESSGAGATTAGVVTPAAVEAERESLDAFMVRFAQDAAPPAAPPKPDQAGTCPETKQRDRDLGILVSPRHPAKGQPVRIIAATLSGEQALAMRVEHEGVEIAVETTHRLGVPAATIGRFEPSATGQFTVVVGREGTGLRCQTFNVRNGRFRDASLADMTRAWEVERLWDSQEEALYSAWVRELFAGPADQDLAWDSLSEVTSDGDRNLLFDHLGRSEDDRTLGMQLAPDCADTPYFLRAYFAYKRGLPFGFRKCSRGKGKPPQCFDLRTNEGLPDLKAEWIDPLAPVLPTGTSLVEHFFRRTIGWGVHTGNGRTAFGDSQSDLYPVALDRRGLRPGIVYADPYGHILVLVELVEPRADKPGILFAIDGQPDASITRKRFWEGNFLWNQQDQTLGGSGFKAFRPLLRVGEGDTAGWIQAGDEAIGKLDDYADVSMMQRELAPLDFYDQMEGLITPGTRNPFAAQAEAVDALAEAVRVRVTSVGNGLDWHDRNPKEIAEMPWGHEVFETSGAWEDYSTPARDLRLLIAIDVVRGFTDKVRRHPEVFGLEDPKLLEQTVVYLEEQQTQLLGDPARAIEYERSDHSKWTLRLDQLLARTQAFELAYNPNDCPEHRWGAPKDSDERSTCRRRAPEDQQAKMRAYRVWFAERRRPARGDAGPLVPELGPAPREPKSDD